MLQERFAMIGPSNVLTVWPSKMLDYGLVITSTGCLASRERSGGMRTVLTMLGKRSSCTLVMVAGVISTGSIPLITQHLCTAAVGDASQSVTQQIGCAWRIAIRRILDRGGHFKNTLQVKRIKVRNFLTELYFFMR